ncbi:MAG: hypothetical protein K6D96_02875 [Acetatifactor sp.]|nr:hypothetical protein [Acetatifactor sp.]
MNKKRAFKIFGIVTAGLVFAFALNTGIVFSARAINNTQSITDEYAPTTSSPDEASGEITVIEDEIIPVAANIKETGDSYKVTVIEDETVPVTRSLPRSGEKGIQFWWIMMVALLVGLSIHLYHVYKNVLFKFDDRSNI